MDPEVERASKEVMVVCPNCKAANKLGNCLKEHTVQDLVEGGLECPDCGQWTHSYWKNDELLVRAERLEQIRLLFTTKPTDGRWQNYNVARQAYNKDFDVFQVKMQSKTKGKEVQPA